MRLEGPEGTILKDEALQDPAASAEGHLIKLIPVSLCQNSDPVN